MSRSDAPVPTSLNGAPDGRLPSGRRLEVLTPSYAPDALLCAQLNLSVLANTPDDTTHRIVVPRSDLGLFDPLNGPRTVVEGVATYLPREFIKLFRVNAWLNVRRPWPPVRGWITQQLIKLEAAARSSADVVLVVDSDIELFRTVTVDDFMVDGGVPLFRRADGVHEQMPRHVRWHEVSHDLLGLGTPEPTPLPDYVCAPCAWDPTTVRGLLENVTDHGGRHWTNVLGEQLHFSEMTLYGVYVEQVLGLASGTSDDMRCINHYEESQLDERQIDALLQSGRASDYAVMISSKSRSPLATRRAAIDRFGRSKPAGPASASNHRCLPQ